MGGARMTRREWVAEALGTFSLVFAGTTAIVTDDCFGGVVTHVGIALAFGLVVTAMIYALGNVSGAHLNPAVTLGFWVARRLPLRQVPGYVLAQCAGAVAASLLVRLLFPEHATLGATLLRVDVARGFLFETVLTFLLMFVILNVSTGAMEKGIMAGVAVGGTVALCALFGGPATGASMNPARSLGPALISGAWTHLWVYLVATPLGAMLAAPLCPLVQGADCCQGRQSGEGGGGE